MDSRKRTGKRRRHRKRRSSLNSDLFDSDSYEDRDDRATDTLSPDSRWKQLQYRMYLRQRMRNGVHARNSVWVDSEGRPVTLAERILRFKVDQQEKEQQQLSSKDGAQNPLDGAGGSASPTEQTNQDDSRANKVTSLQKLLAEYTRQREQEAALSSALLEEIVHAKESIQSEHALQVRTDSASLSLGDSATNVNSKTKQRPGHEVNRRSQLYSHGKHDLISNTATPMSLAPPTSSAPVAGAAVDDDEGHAQCGSTPQRDERSMSGRVQRSVLSANYRKPESGRAQYTEQITTDLHTNNSSSQGREDRNNIHMNYETKNSPGKEQENGEKDDNRLNQRNSHDSSSTSFDLPYHDTSQQELSKKLESQETKTSNGSQLTPNQDIVKNSTANHTPVFQDVNADNQGQNADNQGQNADDQGQNADNQGQNADNQGQNADNQGQNADNQGQNNDNNGQNENLTESKELQHSQITTKAVKSINAIDTKDNENLSKMVTQSSNIKCLNCGRLKPLRASSTSKYLEGTHNTRPGSTESGNPLEFATPCPISGEDCSVYYFIRHHQKRSYTEPEIVVRSLPQTGGDKKRIWTPNNDITRVCISPAATDNKNCLPAVNIVTEKIDKPKDLEAPIPLLKETNSFLPDIKLTNGISRGPKSLNTSAPPETNSGFEAVAVSDPGLTAHHNTIKDVNHTETLCLENIRSRARGLHKELTAASAYYRHPTDVRITLINSQARCDMRIDWGLPDPKTLHRKKQVTETCCGEMCQEQSSSKTEPLVTTGEEKTPVQNEELSLNPTTTCSRLEVTKTVTPLSNDAQRRPRRKPAEFLFVRELTLSRYVARDHYRDQVDAYLQPLLEKSGDRPGPQLDQHDKSSMLTRNSKMSMLPKRPYPMPSAHAGRPRPATLLYKGKYERSLDKCQLLKPKKIENSQRREKALAKLTKTKCRI